MGYSGAWGKLIHKKTGAEIFFVSLPLKRLKVWWQDATLFVYFHILQYNIHTFIQSQ
jgi:hypothetical protein